MPTLRKYRLTLMPAESVNGFIRISITSAAIVRHDIVAHTVVELLDHVKTHAAAYARPCAASVLVADSGRKPAGFDKLTNGLYYNLDIPDTATSA